MHTIRLILAAAACAAAVGAAEASPIRYSGYVLTDVSIGGTVYKGAQVWLRFDSDTRNVAPYSDLSGRGFKNASGRASVHIVSGTTTIDATINSHQVYVFFDVANSAAGFGSYGNGNGYPLMLASPANDQAESISGTLVGAVASIAANSSNASNFTPLTQTLSADLRSPTALAGVASSCPQLYDPVGVTCPLPPATPPVSPATTAPGLMPVPVAIQTSMGALLVYEPYFAVVTVPPGNSNTAIAGNWGMFWSEMRDD